MSIKKKTDKLPSRLIPHLLSQGVAVNGRLLRINYLYSQNNQTRWQVIVSPKWFKKAVQRNKIKRRIKSSFYKLKKSINCNKNLDLLIVPKKEIKEAAYQKVETDFFKLIKQVK